MALDPESQAIDRPDGAADRPAWNTLSPKAARELYLSLRPGAQGPLPAGVKVVDRTIPGSAGELAVRIYRPASVAADAELPASSTPIGGGWYSAISTVTTSSAPARAGSGIAVFAIDYRLAPEARFPGAFDDVVAGLKWVATNGPSVGIDPARLAIGGDSAGGNLAAAGLDLGARPWRAQAPPATSRLSRDRCRGGAESYRRYEDGYGLNAATMEWFFDHYTPDKDARGDGASRRCAPPRCRPAACFGGHRRYDRCATKAAPTPSACNRKAPWPTSWNSAACCTLPELADACCMAPPRHDALRRGAARGLGVAHPVNANK